MARSLPVLRTESATSAGTASPRAVRLSLTDRCDLACVYCRPHRQDGYLPGSERLGVDEWVSLVEGLIAVGVRRVRITGGEPLLDSRLVQLITRLAQLPLDDLALTTNATQLDRLAVPLRRAGLRRLNVSLDSLDADRFARLTRGGQLAQVIAGIDAAHDAGFTGTKLNTVVMRGENDDELEAMTRFAWARDMVPRFLEVMPIGEGARFADRVMPWTEMRARLGHLIKDDETPEIEPDRGPARYLVAANDPSKRVGFISGTTDTFCAGCDRLRVSSDGMLRSCLAVAGGVATKGEANITDAVVRAWKEKPEGATWKGATEETAREVSMRSSGG